MERNEDSAGQNTSSRINKAVFPSGLTEPGSLGIGKNLVHVFQLPFQLVNFRFLLCDGIFQCSHLRGGVCTFFILRGHSLRP